ncbi:MAG: class I SAM-dependent methyltransferase [Myxococcota bacterium]
MAEPEPPRQGPPRSAADWDARYRGESAAPWDTGRVDRNLAALVASRPVAACRALDVGCGTGVEACWMAARGFEVTGVDFAPTAIAQARARAEAEAVHARFMVGTVAAAGTGFGLAYDCGCFHTMPSADARATFAADVAACLDPGGLSVSVLGSKDGPPRDHGPPRLSLAEVCGAVEPRFEILDLVGGTYDARIETPARAWVVVSRVR